MPAYQEFMGINTLFAEEASLERAGWVHKNRETEQYVCDGFIQLFVYLLSVIDVVVFINSHRLEQH